MKYWCSLYNSPAVIFETIFPVRAWKMLGHTESECLVSWWSAYLEMFWVGAEPL